MYTLTTSTSTITITLPTSTSTRNLYSSCTGVQVPNTTYLL